MPPSATNVPLKRRGNRAGCFLGCLSVLIILFLIVGVGWFFILRPYLHDLAQSQLDRAMSVAVQQIPAEAALLPPGPLNVKENTFNNLIVLNLAPSDPIQNVSTRFSPTGIRLDFQAYGSPCTITTLPQATGGTITATNVGIEGIISWIMSPGDLKTLLDKHLNDAQQRLKHPITQVQMKDHTMVVLLGPPSLP